MNISIRPGAFPGERREHIAVVGAGIAGLSAAWMLKEHCDVTVFEEEDWIGGHSHTVDIEGDAGPIAVDTGFIVYNERNYPNLSALFRNLGVATKPSPMSFGVSIGDGKFEYSSADLNGLLGQRVNLVRPRFWRMIVDILHFYSKAKLLEGGAIGDDLTLGAFLVREGYSRCLVEDHILPMCAAIWSTSPGEIRNYPLRSFIRFFGSHGLLNIRSQPNWRTVAGGSREYVKKMVEPLAGRIRTANGARRITRNSFGVSVEDSLGNKHLFDRIVIATHANQALSLLGDASTEERRLLGAFRYTDNRAVLHEDTRLMPKVRRVWSCWNYIAEDKAPSDRALCVTYWMNRLQTIDDPKQLFVTLNPIREPQAQTIHRTFNYSHPVFDEAALGAQPELWRLQGQRQTWFAGSYFGYGFHEDALEAGLVAAEDIAGIERPWQVTPGSSRIARRDPAIKRLSSVEI